MKTSGKQRNNLTYHLSSGIGKRITPRRIRKQPLKTILLSLVLCVFLVLLHSLISFSDSAYAWSDDPNVNTPICTIGYDQMNPQITSDGSGGAIITWEDKRSSNILLESSDIYAQRVNASGDTQWTANGVGICTAVNYQQHPQITSDGSGGAIITWEDYRSIYSDIYTQRVNASGIFQWGLSSGVPICTAGNAQYRPQIISDGSGGAIILWTDHRSGGSETYARRINNWGTPQWWSVLGTGVPICTASNYQYKPQIISDGSGGAIITWEDSRTGGSNIYAQRINWWGELQWNATGVPICTASNAQYKPQIISDGSGGAIITWEDWRSSSNYDIYAQRVNASGDTQWTTNGFPICTASGDQSYPALISDGAGGAVITWEDWRSNCDIYAQRVNASGIPQWTANGVGICTEGNYQSYPALTSDGAGGAIIAWEDYRSGSNWDIYAQQISKDGTLGETPDREEANALPWLFLLLEE